MTSCPGNPRSILETSRDSWKTPRPWDIKTLYFGSHNFHEQTQDVDEIAAPGPHLRSVFGALIDRYGIDVENHKVGIETASSGQDLVT